VSEQEQQQGTTIREIVRKWLVANGYGGLCNPCQECGCALRDFMPCGEPHETECEPGYLHEGYGPDGSGYILSVKSERPSDEEAREILEAW